MKFTELKKEELLEFVTEKQLAKITKWTADHNTKFEVWMWAVEKNNLNPTQVKLNDFYS